MVSDPLSGFHSAAIRARSQEPVRLTFSLSVLSGLACIIDTKAKTFDDAKVHNWGYVPHVHWWPLTPANICW